MGGIRRRGVGRIPSFLLSLFIDAEEGGNIFTVPRDAVSSLLFLCCC